MPLVRARLALLSRDPRIIAVSANPMQSALANVMDARNLYPHTPQNLLIPINARPSLEIRRAERVEFVDTLPLTSVGKIDKKKLREEYRDRLPAGHMPAAAE